MSTDPRPLIAHVLFRFDVGGLENGVVNLLNHLPAHKWRHAVVALDDVSPAFRARVTCRDVEFHAVRKPPGHLLGQYPRLVRLFRTLRPAIVHTRNLAALEANVPAWIAGVAARVHGEHGWDVHDLDGTSNRYRRVRQFYRPFVRHYIALSDQIATYLTDRVGIDRARISRIYNGVDTARFRPEPSASCSKVLPFTEHDLFVIGTVGRLQPVKDQIALVRALARLQAAPGRHFDHLRLVIVGEGPARAPLEAEIGRAGLEDRVWLAGSRDDIPELMRAFDVFALPSLSEGISNTILEAMSTGVPVIATRVGGNAELVADGITGTLVAPGDPEALASAIASYASSPERAVEHGAAGRRRAEERFSIESMVAAYDAVYERQLPSRPLAQRGAEIGA